MRLPDRDVRSKTKVSSPLVMGSLDSCDSNPIDISQSSGSGASFSSMDTVDHTTPLSFNRNYRPMVGSSVASFDRRHSVSRSVGSFVGSYEESILNGRMSQTPSKPLDFTATIGVLGMGKCKSSLRCPPHLTVPFPAYFYSETSPYVGQIDVEQLDGEKSNSKRGYRVPAEGRLQIIIQNPNKTAVKLFLIPYNVSDMPAQSKTFFRQKHYDAADGDKLRYAIHVQICSPSQGKYYVHKSQRVVFANRVPDGKQNLRVIDQGPTPAYTPWVPEKRQRKSDQHSRPDSKEPKFIGGSLLDRDHDIIEQDEALGARYSELNEGQRTPRPIQNHPPLFNPGKRADIADRFALDRPNTITHEDGESRQPSGILAERLKAIQLARDATK